MSKSWAFRLAGGEAVAVGARFAKAERSDLVLGMVLSSAAVVLEASWPKVAVAPGSCAGC